MTGSTKAPIDRFNGGFFFAFYPGEVNSQTEIRLIIFFFLNIE
jgi:hypothetical protein